jgi:hypothetical protein
LRSGGGVLRDLLCEFASRGARECKQAEARRVGAGEKLIYQRDESRALPRARARKNARVPAGIVGEDCLLLGCRFESRHNRQYAASHMLIEYLISESEFYSAVEFDDALLTARRNSRDCSRRFSGSDLAEFGTHTVDLALAHRSRRAPIPVTPVAGTGS